MMITEVAREGAKVGLLMINMVAMELLSWGLVDILSCNDPWIYEYTFIHQKSSSINEIKLNMTE